METEVKDPSVDEVFSSFDKTKPVAILMQPSPDPDCIGAAAGLSFLLKEKYEIDSDIYYRGEVSHPQNRSMVNVLSLDLKKELEINKEDYSAIAVVDTDLHNTGYTFEGVENPDIRIDHHHTNRDQGTVFNDVRNVGSTCSIIWEMLKELGVNIEGNPNVATAMVLGIKTDTYDFSSPNTAPLDLEAFRDLMSYVDRDKLASLIRYPIPENFFGTEAKALSTMQKRGSALVASVGNIPVKHRDHIPIIADHFARIDDIQTVVILGLVGDGLVASVRSDDSRVNVADFCEEIFGSNYSGGKQGSGGATIPLGDIGSFIVGKEAREELQKEMVKNITEKVFNFLG